MSDTPRTDDRTVIIDGNPWVNAPFARQLECELRQACQMYSKLDLHALNLAARITRLEKAGDQMHRNCDAISADKWTKAKEAP